MLKLNPDPQPRRVKVLRVDAEALVGLLQALQKGHRIDLEGMPLNARVVGQNWDAQIGAFLILLESVDFRQVPFAAMPEPITVTITDRTEQERLVAPWETSAHAR